MGVNTSKYIRDIIAIEKYSRHNLKETGLNRIQPLNKQ